MGCKFPEHHGSSGDSGGLLPLVLLAAAAAAVCWLAVRVLAFFSAVPWPVVAAVTAVLLAVRPGLLAWRFARAAPAARRHFPGMIRARLRWHWLARNTGLAPVELAARNRPDGETGRGVLAAAILGRFLGGLVAALIGLEIARGPRNGKIHYPRARFRPDPYGWQCTYRTKPRSGRKEADKASAWVADYWQCARVAISQPRPGRIMLRALRRDPLAELLGPDRCPLGTFAALPPRQLYVGRDEFGADRWLPLSGVTGLTVAGLPGGGKTSCISGWLCQLAGSAAVQFAMLDGKDGGDHVAWHPRAWLHAGDDLQAAVNVLEDVHAEMRRRLRRVRNRPRGSRNLWHAGPAADCPLLVTVLDECQTFLDLAAVKGDKAREPLVRRCIVLVQEIVRKGRSVMCMVWLATQKPTGDSLPPAIRDCCALSVSFVLRTADAAVAALGSDVREYPDLSPVSLRQMADPTGCCVATLPSGMDPLTKIRVPWITEEWAEERAAATAQLRRDPSAVPAPAVPAGGDAPEPATLAAAS
ncbi:MAG: hypothetical protein ACLQDY_08360 [Streptosporangiaceae bacterium]